MTKKSLKEIFKSGVRRSQLKEKAIAKVGTRGMCSKDKGNFNKYGLNLTRGQVGRTKLEA